MLEIDLMSNRGDIILLNGPSGAGKSTLLRIVAGLVQPDQGMIRFEEETWYDDHENINLSPQERHIGFVFQDYALFPHLSAARNITFGLNDSGQAPSKLEHLLKWMELEEVREHPPGQLSGGQQQRVAIARALAVEPPLLLLDEPFSALDLTLRQKLAVELAEAVKTSGQTLILVSHDQSFILEKADRIWTLNEGKIEETIC